MPENACKEVALPICTVWYSFSCRDGSAAYAYIIWRTKPRLDVQKGFFFPKEVGIVALWKGIADALEDLLGKGIVSVDLRLAGWDQIKTLRGEKPIKDCAGLEHVVRAKLAWGKFKKKKLSYVTMENNDVVSNLALFILRSKKQGLNILCERRDWS